MASNGLKFSIRFPYFIHSVLISNLNNTCVKTRVSSKARAISISKMRRFVGFTQIARNIQRLKSRQLIGFRKPIIHPIRPTRSEEIDDSYSTIKLWSKQTIFPRFPQHFEGNLFFWWNLKCSCIQNAKIESSSSNWSYPHCCFLN